MLCFFVLFISAFLTDSLVLWPSYHYIQIPIQVGKNFVSIILAINVKAINRNRSAEDFNKYWKRPWLELCLIYKGYLSIVEMIAIYIVQVQRFSAYISYETCSSVIWKDRYGHFRIWSRACQNYSRTCWIFAVYHKRFFLERYFSGRLKSRRR